MKWNLFIIFAEDTNQGGTKPLANHFAGQDENSKGTNKLKERHRENQNKIQRGQVQHYEE